MKDKAKLQKTIESEIDSFNPEVDVFIIGCLQEGRIPDKTDALYWQDEKLACTAEDFLNRVQFLYDNHKADFNVKNKPGIVNTINHIKESGCRRNIVLNRIENRKGQHVTLDNLYIRLLLKGIKTPQQDLRSLIASDEIPTYHPFLEYLNSVKDIDLQNTDWFKKLSEYIKTDEPEFFAVMLKKHIIRTIDQYFRNIPNRYVFAEVGAQEAGKSAHLRHLNPLGIEYYSETPLRGDKDNEILLAKTLIYNIEELEGLSKTEVNKIKSFISRWVINERAPYAAQAEARPRLAALFASTNDREFLTDVVNSRWLIFDIKDIDYNYCNLATGRIDVPTNMLWAQAYREWQRDNNSGQLTPEEKQKQTTRNKLYEISSPEFHLILKHFKEPEPEELEHIEFLSSTDILLRLTGLYPSIKINAVWIGREMGRAGFKSRVSWVNGRSIRGYDLIFNNEGYGNTDKIPF